MTNYSIWMLEYAHCPQPVSSVIYSQHNQGEKILTLSHMVLKSDEHTIMIDTGFDYRTPSGKHFGDKFGVTDWQPPEKVLAKIGVRPEDVEVVLLTHAHYDHMGAIKLFPNARFYIQKKELDEWWKVLEKPRSFSFLTAGIDPVDMDNAKEMLNSGQMVTVEGDVINNLPGIDLFPVYDSHTYGSQIITIRNDISPSKKEVWVVSGDNCYSYTNLLGVNNDGIYLPVGFGVGSQSNMIQALDTMMTLANGDVKHILVGHATESWEYFPSYKGSDGCYLAEISLAPGQKSFIP